MLFNSFQFFIFLGLVYGLYRLLPHRQQNLLLLAASYFFYGSWDWRFLFLILLSTVVDYVIGLKLVQTQVESKRKQLVAYSVIVNLSILGFFKYFNFFAESLAVFLGSFGIEADYRLLNIVLPVGISFYTFQTMTYSIDIYRGQIKPTRHFFDFALFVAFFPQLVAGPIERASNLLPQVLSKRQISFQKSLDGCWLILWGLFKKVVIADNLAIIVNAAFADYQQLTALEVTVAVYAFAFQIYCDFSGYSDIARGVAKLLGFELMLNFNLPYFARNPSDFWRRWHISLSTWLRDYLYVPLGGNRYGSWKTYRNLMLTMILGGLWHGAAWTFVVWGIYQGGLLAVHRALSGYIPSEWSRSWVFNALSILIMFQFVCLGWLIFRAESFAQLQSMTLTLVLGWSEVGAAFTMLRELTSIVWPLLIIQCYQALRKELLLFVQWPYVPQVVCSGFLAYMIFVYGALEGQEFIYFQF